LPIDYVFVSSDNKSIELLSNKEGKFILIPDNKIKSFTFYKIGYYSKSIITSDLLRSDTIYLLERTVDLNEIVITPKIIDTLVKDKKYYVNDYLVLPNYDFLLITSKINNPGFEVCYYKKRKGITCVKKFKKTDGEYLFRDCFKNIHLVTNKFSGQIFFNSDGTFDFLPKYSKGRFDSTLAITALKLDTMVLIKSFKPPFKMKGADFDIKRHSPFLTYIGISKHIRQNYYTVAYNKSIREMLNYEDFDWDRIAADTKLIGGKLSGYVIESQRALFYSKIAGPIYAPVFLKNDSIIIFNFQENVIVFLNRSGKIISNVEMDHKQFPTLHDFEMIYDVIKQKFYFKTKESDRSILNLVNVYTGKILKKIHLEKPFAKNIQIMSDKIYYLVKEKEWDDTSYLYQQN
jgi:hypothetical protein